MRKLLVANRSEIAIRCFRAATELGPAHRRRLQLRRSLLAASLQGRRSVSDRPAAGRRAGPLVPEHRRASSRSPSSTASTPFIPGYGFLAESAAFARACEEAGIRFVGPTPSSSTCSATRPRPSGSRSSRRADDSRAPSRPIASRRRRRGRGRAHRLSADDQGELRRRRPRHARRARAPTSSTHKLDEAQREAGAAFGRPDVFLERYIPRAKHIEVQILGDAHGNLVHLWERDCSVQRRHQKVVEVAPSINARRDPARARSATRPSRLCRSVGYRSAGTVEFLLDVDRGEFYFIEVNPRIQVEHTVTEMVTGIDLVRSQILVADGHRLHEAPLSIPAQDDDRAARRRDAVPHHDRRSGAPFHPRLRPHHDLSLGRRVRRPARRRQRLRRRGHHAVLRLAARQGHDLGRHARGSGPARPTARCASSASAASRRTSRSC